MASSEGQLMSESLHDRGVDKGDARDKAGEPDVEGPGFVASPTRPVGHRVRHQLGRSREGLPRPTREPRTGSGRRRRPWRLSRRRRFRLRGLRCQRRLGGSARLGVGRIPGISGAYRCGTRQASCACVPIRAGCVSSWKYLYDCRGQGWSDRGCTRGWRWGIRIAWPGTQCRTRVRVFGLGAATMPMGAKKVRQVRRGARPASLVGPGVEEGIKPAEGLLGRGPGRWLLYPGGAACCKWRQLRTDRARSRGRSRGRR